MKRRIATGESRGAVSRTGGSSMLQISDFMSPKIYFIRLTTNVLKTRQIRYVLIGGVLPFVSFTISRSPMGYSKP